MSEKSAPPLERTSYPFEEPAWQEGACHTAGLREAELGYPIPSHIACAARPLALGDRR
jgi:hypothetical protein